MGVPRPHEVLSVLRALEELACDDPLSVRGALGTLVTLDGALRERSGALALLRGGESSIPEGLGAGVEKAIHEQTCAMVEFDLQEDEPLFGPGGLSGRAEVWVEPITGELREQLREARRMLLGGEGLVIQLSLTGEESGRRRHFPADHLGVKALYGGGVPELEEEAGRAGIRRVFRLPLVPMGKAVILGSGEDARLLAERLDALGFVVTVADHRPGRLIGRGWDGARWRLVEGGWEAARAAARPDADTYVVVMTHSYSSDGRALRGALSSPARYVGLVGSSGRAARLLAELADKGLAPGPGVFSAPAGLEIGAETPEELSVAVASEILAMRFGLKGGRPSRLRPAGSSPASRKGGVRVPGLVLAAGRGRRFGAGSKLLADVDGRPVLRHVVEAALASRLDPVIVVLGSSSEAGLRAIEGLENPRLRVVFNPSWRSGKASSFEVGLREAPAEAPGVVALLGDMPRVKPWLIDRVLAEFELSGKLCFPVVSGVDGQVKGHPTAYPRGLFGEVGQLVGDDTAMAAVRRHWSEAVKIPLEDASTQVDIDTAEDLELLKVRPLRRSQ